MYICIYLLYKPYYERNTILYKFKTVCINLYKPKLGASLNEQIIKKVGACYRAGGYDAEACDILVQYVEGFEPSQFEYWLEREPELRLVVEGGRILARGYWDCKIKQGYTGKVPAWYWFRPEAWEPIILMLRAVESLPLGSETRERESKNVARIIAAIVP